MGEPALEVGSEEGYNSSDPVNLGGGEEISIRKLVTAIADLTDFDGDIEWDTSKPDSQPRRKLDTTRAKARFDWEAATPFGEVLEAIIEGDEAHRDGLQES